MEQSSEGIGIKIYSASKRVDNSSSSMYPTSLPEDVPIPELPQQASIGGKKSRAMASGVQKTLSKTSLLVNFLPTGTLLTFEMLLPSVFGKGDCSPITTFMILTLLGLCTLSCFFFHFTDSFRGPDGKVYYGFVTPRGLKVFKTGLGVEIPKDERYIVGLTDFVHAMMSVLVFVAIAFSDHRVTLCLFPGHAKELDEIMRSFPLMVGVICSGLFLVFPNTRYGVGCMSA
ncbi:protein DMP9-like [Capsicum annuum]|nr:protein DMP9-like [Capsicum annuum]